MTVLVGANGTGKTTALLALAFLHRLATDGLQAMPTLAERISASAPEFMIGATAELTRPGAASTETVTWQLAVGLTTPRPALRETLRRIRPLHHDGQDSELATFALGTGRWRDEGGRLVEHTMSPGELALTTATSPAARSQLIALRQSMMRWRIEVAILGTLTPTSAPTNGYINELGSAYRRHPDALAALREHARAITGIRDLRFGFAGGITIEEASGTRVDLRLASTGVARVIEILVQLFAPEPPALLAIDELENHLHGDLAARLIDAMRSVSHRTQIVVTTHSARVLRCFQPSEVRLVRRDGGGSSIVAVDDDPRLRRLAEVGDLGALIEDGYFAGGM